ncbi:hypothetical protein D3C75_797900 [compost metagenome]
MVCTSASGENCSLAISSTPIILNRIIRISRDTAKPAPIPTTMEPKYRIRFSALSSRKILPLVSPINWNRPISRLRRLMKMVLAYSRNMATITTSRTEEAPMAAPPLTVPSASSIAGS